MAKSCIICGSKRWRKDKVTGSAVCEEGHVRQDYRSETLVMDQTGPGHHMTRRRTGAKGSRTNKRREEGRANPNYYHGDEAEYLQVQALQLLLRLQIQALSKLWSLPDAFEMIVRDLWAYQLAMSVLPTLPDPSRHSTSPSPPPPPPMSQKSTLLDVEMADDEKSDESTDDKHESESDKGDSSDADSELDPDILERLDESDKEEGEQSDGMDHQEQKRDAMWRRRRRLKVSDTIITLVVGLWFMRIPIIGSDIENLINQMKIPYIDFGHTTYISPAMRQRMDRDVMITLSPLRSPSASMLHRSCRLLARQLDKRFGIQVPEINIHPVAWRIISSLGGTPTIYVQTIRLMTILDLNLSLLERETDTITRPARSRTKKMHDADDESGSENEDEEAPLEKTQTYEKAIVYLDVIAPEVVTVASWIIVMKMVYGLDGIPREALLKTDPAIGLQTGQKWLKELRHRLENGTLRYNRKDLEKHEFTKMDEDELDGFLAKSQEVLLGNRAEPPDVAPFPLSTPLSVPPPLIVPNSWHMHHDTVPSIAHTPIRPSSADKAMKKKEDNKSLPLMPGEKVRHYDSSETFLELPTDSEVVLNGASELISWDWKDVLRVVGDFERKLERQRPKNEYKPATYLDIDGNGDGDVGVEMDGNAEMTEEEDDQPQRLGRGTRRLTRSQSHHALNKISRTESGSRTRESSFSLSRQASRAPSRSGSRDASLSRAGSGKRGAGASMSRTGSGSRLKSSKSFGL